MTNIQPATIEAAKKRWKSYTRSVVTDEVLRYTKEHGLFFAHDPRNHAPVVMTQNGDGTFMPLFWFYVDTTNHNVFASVERIGVDTALKAR
jgi:hypothetical protein